MQNLYSMKSQLDYFTLGTDRLEIDILGHFEDLTQNYNQVHRILNLPNAQLKHRNRTTNADKDYRQLYDNQMVEIISKLFYEEILLFDYEYESAYPHRHCSVTKS